ncbi:ABC transporter substrate-binding protein [Sinorhizobium meliloti]|nr:ABC transporter substrate-binding protein [Sinorhizobium meliloti]
MQLSKLGLPLVALFISAAPALAGPSDDTLNVVWEREQTTLDVYYFTDHTGLTLIKNVWDGLVERDPTTGAFVPNLATSWEMESDTSIVFKLREGVTFHNGEEFDADDVVYTLNYVTKPENKVLLLQTISWIAGAEKIDKYTVRVNMKQPFPAALEYLSLGVPIYPDEYYAQVGTKGMGVKPVGTGPYKVVSFEPGREYVLERFDNYFEGGGKRKPAIKTVSVRTQKDTNLMIGELMTGNADFLWRLSPDQVDNLEMSENFKIIRSPTLRVSFLAFSLKDPKSPFADKRVRQAIAHAVDRDGIAQNLIRGSSRKLETVCSPDQSACPKPGVTYTYDPEKARSLLAEAGYAGGFSTKLTSTSDRFITEAVSGDLAKVGIQADVETLVWATFREKWVRNELPVFNGGTGFWGISDASIAFGTYFGGMPQDLSNDPSVNKLLKQAESSYDAEAREKLYEQAQDIILENAYWVPLVLNNVNYAFVPELNFVPMADEVNRFYLASWK